MAARMRDRRISIHLTAFASVATAMCSFAVHVSCAEDPAAAPVPLPAAIVRHTADGVPVYRLESISPLYKIDRIFKSMQGPMALDRRILFKNELEPELLWMISYEAEVTKPDGSTPESAEFMCHSAMDTDAGGYQRNFQSRLKLHGNRLFSVDQGTTAMHLPEGFGIPLMSDQSLLIATQVLNHNVVDRQLDVRQRVSIDFVRNSDLKTPLRPLIQTGVFGMVLVEGPDGHVGVTPGAGEDMKHGPGCSLGADAGHVSGYVRDEYGRHLSSFWVVEPGKHSYHTRVTGFLELPFDTTVHYAAAHLHPYAESLELYDVTAKRSVIKLGAKLAQGKVGLADVEQFSSTEGVPIYKGHEYDLIATYDNTSGVKQDAMATMFLYVAMRDLAFLPNAETRGETFWRRVPAGPLAKPKS